MQHSRRTLLAGLALSGTSGCLDLGQSADQPGGISCDDEYRSPTSDGTLPGINQDWPAPQYDTRNTGYNDAVSSTQTNCGRVRWIQELASEEDGVVGGATLRNGTVYVSRRTEVVALDATSGQVEWRVAAPHRIWTAPVVSTDRAFVGTRSGLVAVDIASQRVDWTTALDETAFDAIDDPGWITRPPAVSGGRVFVGTRAGQFAAVNAATGAVDWSVTVTRLPEADEPPADANLPWFAGPPAVDDGVVVVGNWNRRLYAFDAQNGDELWQQVGAARSEPAPTIVGETVLATTQVDMTARRLADGSVRWTHRGEPGSVTLSATVVDDTVHVASGDAYSSLSIIALDRTNGTIDWRLPGRPQTSASADPGTLYLGLNGNLVAIDRDTGRVAWEMTMQSVASGPPIVTDSAVIALDERGTLYAIDTSG